MKTIICYSGGFQPFGPHHFKSYKFLCQLFGEQNVYICTSNHVTDQRPLNYEEKVQCILKYQVNKNQIVQVKNPYNAVELTSRFNPNTTSIIYAFGNKDSGRFQFKEGGYFKEFYGQKQLNPLIENGYIFELPHISIKYNGTELSGTYLRELLPNVTKEEFREIMGYYDDHIHFLFKKKFHPDILELTKTLFSEGSSITKTQLQRIEQYADQLFKQFNIDINFQDLSKATHFWQRINDPRNVTPITTDELCQLFKKASQRFGQQLAKVPSGYEAILKDMETDINLPFMIVFDRKNNELDLIPKTIMRKPNFTDKQKPFLKLENRSIQHIYDEANINEFVDALMINTDKIDYCMVKVDGMNLKLTFKNGQFRVARNKAEFVNPLTMEQLIDKYSDKPAIQAVFVNALKDLSRLPDQEVFQNGRVFLNLEVYHPSTKNVFDYGNQPFLSLHTLQCIDETGNVIMEDINLPKSWEFIQGKTFKIQFTPRLTLKKFPEPFLINHVLEMLKMSKNKKQVVLYMENLIIQNICKSLSDVGTNTSEQIISSVQRLGHDINDTLKLFRKVGKLNPIEGIVFRYTGSIYKCTGSYAALVPVYQIYNKHKFQKQ